MPSPIVSPVQTPATKPAAPPSSDGTSGAGAGLPPGQPPSGQSDDLERKKREAEIKATGAKLKAEKDALNKQRSDILAAEKALKAERDEIAEYKRLRALATADPDAFLAPVYGKDWRDSLAKATAGDTAPLQIRQLRDEWEAERKKQAEIDEKRRSEDNERQTAAQKKKEADEAAAFQSYVNDISTGWMDKNKEAFPTLHATGLGYMVAHKVHAIYQESGKVAKEEDVAKDLEEQLDKVLDTVYGTKKWSEKLAAKLTPATPVGKPNKPQMQYVVAPRKAISQDMSAGSGNKEKPLTREEKKAAMLARVRQEQGNTGT